MTFYEKQLSKRLTAVRRKAGYSQTEAARILGLTLKQYRAIEKEGTLTARQLSILSERFNMKI